MNRIIKTFLITALAIIFSGNYTFSQTWTIKKGEKLSYKIAFSSALTGDVKGGEATLSVSSSEVSVGGRNSYLAILSGATTGFIEWFYQVENRYETFIDVNSYAPLMYRQTVRENKYRSSDTVYFDQQSRIATYQNKRIRIPANTHDFVSMIYYVRSLDVSKLKKGDHINIAFFTSDKVMNSKIIYQGIEQVKVNGNNVNCYAFKPQVAKGKMFNQDYPATLWISADNKRLPMLIEARMKVGRVKMELTKAE